ncbi:MAG TPA: c-type cytochrome [Anaerolineales bacterium]|nr:c-type cytochrome [Anaerolineales bacterium]
MNEKEKQEYLESYHQAKQKGPSFFPDVVAKDAVVALLLFLALAALAYFLGAPLEARANPADTSYTPRPEWYFLFLFQLLKYFPGKLEVIGVIIIPTIGIGLLFFLPFLDRSSKRHARSRPIITGGTALVVVAVSLLTVQAVREAPPPADTSLGDPTAALYVKNCAGCHGPSISVPASTNLHAVIAQGKHEGMPAWSADLTSDEIDALAGFIASPDGSRLFTQNCGECHQASELVASDPLELRSALQQGIAYAPHVDLGIPEWTESLSAEERTALLNFLVAPDGQRLFAVNCALCHGRSVSFSGEETALRQIIQRGGLHLEMPPWREMLSPSELDTLASYVVEPSSAPGGQQLFSTFCTECHGDRVPAVAGIDKARQAIAGGGGHETMPVWGEILTSEQLDALVAYTLEAASGAPLQLGQTLFAKNCTICHGDFGEGGPNPTRADDIIAPISSAEFLQTRDNPTLRAIISRGQPNFGMSPFGTAFGGPLDDEDIDALVAFIRSWEEKPPVEFPPEVVARPISLEGPEIYAEVCAQCHAKDGGGLIGPSLRDPTFQARFTDQTMFDTINRGHSATAMIGWGEILTADQIQQLVKFIRGLPGNAAAAPSSGASFAADVLPILKAKCSVCHGSLGGWDASSFQSVMQTGNNSPVVVPGDVDNSLLAQKILGSQQTGAIMPPGGALPQGEIKTILDWIAAGAPDN